MIEFADPDELLLSLERLTQGDNPHVIRMEQHGARREDRYGHLFSGEPEPPAAGTSAATEPPGAAPAQRSSDIDTLRAEVALLRKQIDELYALTGHIKATE